MRDVPVTVVSSHPLARWLLPLGLAGLGLFYVAAVVTPSGFARYFEIARIVYTLVYVGLCSVALTPRRRSLRLRADISGLHDAETDRTLTANDQIVDVLYLPKADGHELQVRGRRPFTMVLTSADDARAVLHALRRDSDDATHVFLAKTTPTAYVVMCWMGLPVVAGFAIQYVSMTSPPVTIDRPYLMSYVPVAILFVLLWLGSTIWFARRRQVVISPTTMTYPRLFGGHHTWGYASVERVQVLDPFTVRFKVVGERARTFKIYNPDEVTAYVRHVQGRIAANR